MLFIVNSQNLPTHTAKVMRYETLFIMVRVSVHSSHTRLADIVSEIETCSIFRMDNTPKVKILETEILLSRVRNPKVHRTPIDDNL